MERVLNIDPSSLLTKEVCLGSVLLVTVVGVVAAAITIYRQRRMLGAESKPTDKREAAEGQDAQEKAKEPGAGDDDVVFKGRWPTNKLLESGEKIFRIKKKSMS